MAGRGLSQQESDAISSIFEEEMKSFATDQDNTSFSDLNEQCKQVWSNWDFGVEKPNTDLGVSPIRPPAIRESTIKSPATNFYQNYDVSPQRPPNNIHSEQASEVQNGKFEVSSLKNDIESLCNRINTLTNKNSPSKDALKQPSNSRSSKFVQQPSPLPIKIPEPQGRRQSIEEMIQSTAKLQTKNAQAQYQVRPSPELEKLRSENEALKAQLAEFRKQQSALQSRRIELEALIEQSEKTRAFYKKQSSINVD